MMNPVHPWIDADEVKRLSEQLLQQPPTQHIPTMENAAFGTEFVGFTENPSAPAEPVPLPRPPQPVAPPTPQAIPVPVISHAQIPVATPVPIPATQATPESPTHHYTAFCEWMHTQFSANGLFLLDHEGNVVFDETKQGKLHFLARGFAQAPRRAGATTSHVRVRIATAAFLEIISVEAPMGDMMLGSVVPTALKPYAVQQIRQELLRSIRS